MGFLSIHESESELNVSQVEKQGQEEEITAVQRNSKFKVGMFNK